MILRTAPPAATGLLKLLCPGPEYDSVIGDLMEQYQQGHGSLWYWRQVLAIVVLGLYRKPGRRPLISTNRIPIGAGFALILVIAALSAALLSGIGPILLVGVLCGVLMGIFKFGRPDRGKGLTTFNAPKVVRIDSSKISISGGIGAGILILILLTAVLHDLPLLRVMAVPGILAGLFFAVVLRLWRKGHVPAPPMSLGLKNSAIENVKDSSIENALRGKK